MDTVRKPRAKISGIDKTSFLAWLNSASPGQICIYFTGHSLGDATPETQETAKEVRERFARGQIELAQRRLPNDGKLGPLEYLAIKRQHIREPMVGGSKWRPYLTHADQLAYCPKWVHA
jgi:hypothetical protein